MLTTFIYFPVKLGLLQLYPAYIGYKAIKANDQQQFGSLLTFWIVSIVYLAIEYFSDMFLFWMPFYTEIKLVIVLWLILPQTQGAALVYTRYLDPFLNQHETEIDHVLVEIQFRVKKTIVSYGKQCLKTLRKTLLQTIFRSKGQQEAEEEEETTTTAITAAAAAVETTGASVDDKKDDLPVIKETGNYIIHPYNLFSTFISTTASRFQQQQQPSSSNENKAGDAASPADVNVREENDVKRRRSQHETVAALDRTESQESLNSYVNVKGSASPTGLTTTPSPESPPQQHPSPPQEPSENASKALPTASGWGGYLLNFGRVFSSRPNHDEPQKKDQ